MKTPAPQPIKAPRVATTPHQPLIHCPTCQRHRPVFEFTILDHPTDTSGQQKHQWLFCIQDNPEEVTTWA